MRWPRFSCEIHSHATEQIISTVVAAAVESAISPALDQIVTQGRSLLTSSLVTLGQGAISSLASVLSGYKPDLIFALTHGADGDDMTDASYRVANFTPDITKTVLLPFDRPVLAPAGARYTGVPTQTLYPGRVSHTFAPEAMLMASQLQEMAVSVNLSRQQNAAAPYDLGSLTQLLARTHSNTFTQTSMPDFSFLIAVALHIAMSGPNPMTGTNPALNIMSNFSFGGLVNNMATGDGAIAMQGMCYVPYVSSTRAGALAIAHFIREGIEGRGINYHVDDHISHWTTGPIRNWAKIHGFRDAGIYQLGTNTPNTVVPIAQDFEFLPRDALVWLTVHAPPEFIELALYHLASTSLRAIQSDVGNLVGGQTLARITPRHAEAVTLNMPLLNVGVLPYCASLAPNPHVLDTSGRVYLPQHPPSESMLFFALLLRTQKSVRAYDARGFRLLFRNMSAAMAAAADIDLTTLNSFPYATGPGDTHEVVKQQGLDYLAEHRYVTTVPRTVDAMNVPWTWSAPSLHNFPTLTFSPKDRFSQRGRVPGILTEAYTDPFIPIKNREERPRVKPGIVPNTMKFNNRWDGHAFLGAKQNPGDAAEMVVTIPGLRGPYVPTWIRYGSGGYWVRYGDVNLDLLITQRTRERTMDLDFGPELNMPAFHDF